MNHSTQHESQHANTEPMDLEATVLSILKQPALEFIENTVSKHFGRGYESSELTNIEKVNIVLALAAQKKIKISHEISRIIKQLNTSLPDGQLNQDYFRKMNGAEKKRFLHIISSIILLVSMGLGVGFSTTNRIDAANQKNKSILSSDFDENRAVKAAKEKTKFERLYSDELQIVVDEMGWKEFLLEYAKTNDEERKWTEQEVFQLLHAREPRYWGMYIVSYPHVFLQTVDNADVTLVEFLSSCGRECLSAFRKNDQVNANWLDLWSSTELLQVIKNIYPNWATIVVSNQQIFAEALTKEDIVLIVQQLTAEQSLIWLLNGYDVRLDEKISRRELLDLLKTYDTHWHIGVRSNPELFANVLTKDELEDIVIQLSSDANQRDLNVNTKDFNIIKSYYSLKLYRVINPNSFSELIKNNFNPNKVDQIFASTPTVIELENRSIDELFQTQAIHYILENYDSWEKNYSVEDIMSTLRETGNNYYYAQIVMYPHLFTNINFTDQEVRIMAFQDYSIHLVGTSTHFFENYNTENGWHNQISIDRILTIERNSNPNTSGLYAMATIFPELFIPHFSAQDLVNLAYYGDAHLRKANVLQSNNPIWQTIAPTEKRRSILETAKSYYGPQWVDKVEDSLYLFEEILTFEELQQILSRNYYAISLRDTQVWQKNTTPEWEYTFFKSVSDQAFAFVVIDDPTRFSNLLTEADKEILLKHHSYEIMIQYRFWKNELPPEYILDFFQKNKETKDYGRIVLRNKHVFGHLFYNDDYSFRDVVTYGDPSELFYYNQDNLDVTRYFYEEWSDFANLEELFEILILTDRGKAVILKKPNLFFNFVEKDNLNLFTQTSDSLAALVNNYSSWKELWGLNDIYDSAKKNNTKLATHVFFSSEHALDFFEITKTDDLNFLVGSYPDEYAFIFENAMPFLLGKWTSEEILKTLKEEYPNNWAAFISQKHDSFFKPLINEADLQTLIENGADPDGLVGFGLWEVSKILDMYQAYTPNQWGEIVLRHPHIFMEEIKSRNISLRELLLTSDIRAIENDLYGWFELWPEAEIWSIIYELYPDFIKNVSFG